MLPPLKGFARRLLRWYDRSRRDLPWRQNADRPGPLDPYHVLVSETMLQQTQVATVIPYYHQFLAKFPTIADLAAAPEQEVLRLWQGLGYYSRARNLHAAAKQVLADHDGQLPRRHDQLLTLPGIGRYTAGAIASIAFETRIPILDGNVTRVLCRLDCIRTDPRDRPTQELLWLRAEQVLPKRRIGDFNSALMELGATVCTPRNPQCLICPVQMHCEAFAAGLQEKIPAPKKAKPTPLVHRRTYCIRWDDKWLIEQRPAKGRWAGMWQFVTVEAPVAEMATAKSSRPPAKAKLPLAIIRPVRLGSVSHALTHRRYKFEVFVARAKNGDSIAEDRVRHWVTLEELEPYPLPRPHLKMVEMLRDFQG